MASALAKFGSKSWMLLVMLKYRIGYVKNEGGYKIPVGQNQITLHVFGTNIIIDISGMPPRDRRL